jgi:hypothetical protein
MKKVMKSILCSVFTIVIGLTSITAQKNHIQPHTLLQNYRTELNSFRNEYGGSIEMPDVKFFLFGMGNRTKYIYSSGVLKNSQTNVIVKKWDVRQEIIVPSEYAVYLIVNDNQNVMIKEDEKGIRIDSDGKTQTMEGTKEPVILPRFDDYKYPQVMRVLLQEILVNIVDGKPVPNYFVYTKPWYRDASMMAMCLKQTGNINLIKSWILDLVEPYDRNNAGEKEADNLGQALYLISLVSDKNHPLVKEVLNEALHYEQTNSSGTYIKGRSDFHEVPAYQTKWLKYGIKCLGLDDKYTIPLNVDDNYSSLFWWDYKSSYKNGTIDSWDEQKNPDYPYLGWAADHFHGLKRNFISNRDYPVTWERKASQANYSGMTVIDTVYTRLQLCVPHTWHASEVFLYLLDQNK